MVEFYTRACVRACVCVCVKQRMIGGLSAQVVGGTENRVVSVKRNMVESGPALWT